MKIIVKLLLVISIILFAYILYQSEIYWKGTKFNYYLKYYLILFFLIIYFLLLNFLSKKITQVNLVTFSSIIFSLYFFEIYTINTSFKYEKNNIKSIKARIYKEKYNKNYDKRTLKEVFNDEVRPNESNVLAVYPSSYLFNNFLEKSNTEIFPLSGISKKNTILCNENGYYSNYISDRYGFNNPDYEWENKNIEFMLLGDSFVHGSCVNPPDDLGSRLRIISKGSVLNLGYGGNGPIIQLASLKEYSTDIKIKNILWFFHESNDMINLDQELQNKRLKKYLDFDDHLNHLKQKQDLINKINLKNLNESFKNIKNTEDKKNQIISNLKNFIKLNSTRRILFEKNKNYNYEIYKSILKKAKQISIKQGSNIYFIYLPDFETYSENKNKYAEVYKNIKTIVNELEINFIDIHKDFFLKQKNPLIFFPFEMKGHYNKDGYLNVANTIYNKVK